MRRSAAAATALILSCFAVAAPAKVTSKIDHAKAEAQVLELTKQIIAMRSVRGEDNKTGEVAQALKTALLAGGWTASDVEITPLDDTAYLIATWKGSDPSLKPLVISAHMDVVEAKPSDWQRDPFTPVVENGYLYGRGASDQKFSLVLAMVGLIELRKTGFKPRRSIVLAFSGDEETTMKTSRIIADRLAGAELVLNTDSWGGVFDEKTGQPLYWPWEGAEKSYVDFRLEVTNPGGHSSTPRPENAIAQMATALARIGSYRFKPEQNALTKEYFIKAAQFESDPSLAAAMRTFSANPNDTAALAALRASPQYAGQIATTCVPTMVNGGHAENALPQRVTANVNCRVFPGRTRAEIMAELEQVAGVPEVKFSDHTGGDSTESPASPMRADLLKAVEKAMAAAWPKVPLIPSQSTGASDSMWYRAKGVPAYAMNPMFYKVSDEFSHGLNERARIHSIRPALVYYLSLLPALSK